MRGKVVGLVLALLLACCCALGVEAPRYAVRGSADRFWVDAKTGALQLGDCVVTRVRAHRYHWQIPDVDMPGAYAGRHTVQRIFDLLDGCAMLAVDGQALAAQEAFERGYYAYAGMEIDFESPKGAARPPITQRPGQGYGTIRLEPLSHVSGDFPSGSLYVHFALFTQQGKAFENFYVQSGALHRLVMEACQPSYDLDPLRAAQSLSLFDCADFAPYAIPKWNPNQPATVEDAALLGEWIDVLLSGAPLAQPAEVVPSLLLRFHMPDISIRALRVAFCDADPDVAVAVVGARQYAVDARRLRAALAEGGL